MKFTKSAIVFGASRGIGRQIALTLARNGYNVGVAAKTTDNSSSVPGTIFSVCEEIEELGVNALPIKCDVRSVSDINEAVETTLTNFGKIDYAIYNAGAILWKPVIETPMKRFDLMHEVNVRGAYGMVQAVLPHMLEQKHGRILLVSPPIYSRFFKGKTAYAVSKVGMTVLVHGMAHELTDTGVTISALWPATATESHVTVTYDVPRSETRTPQLFADACLAIGEAKGSEFNGRALIDEDMLREWRGVEDFRKYRSDPDVEPPRIMPRVFPSLRVAEEDEVQPPARES